MKRVVLISMLSAGSLALGACAKKAPEELPPPPVDTSVPTSTPTPTPTGPIPGTQAHFENAVNGQNVIYFDTDQYNVDTVDAGALQTQAQYLMQYSNVNATIQGHTDERGTRDYNLALGERRANSAKNYLVGLGVPAARLQTVSYGKEQPVATGSNAQAWAQNRRAATIVIN
ncbi:peptidoglycan-associated lipoprotein Pal [Altererythrobacter sp. ZODW24]|uniref:peptidoglycan-associated lipoprotein Pal n=1 Tax=Altererythrobacter sp. ZODW24 TaxID=2185142 RepID=UPI000DF73EE0|nr:peptidoglycan-associated lipoprotein Pal [Altererythrobacter sp. ZODW24]